MGKQQWHLVAAWNLPCRRPPISFCFGKFVLGMCPVNPRISQIFSCLPPGAYSSGVDSLQGPVGEPPAVVCGGRSSGINESVDSGIEM